MGSDTPKPKPSALLQALNAAGLCGWAGVMIIVLHDPTPSPALLRLTLGTELLCAVEVALIYAGVLRGRLILGLILHYTRLLILLGAAPLASAFTPLGGVALRLTLLSWSLTEVCRYPMLLFPNTPPLRKLRYALPALTFPIGAAAEAFVAAAALAAPQQTPLLLRALLTLIIPTNAIGGIAAYEGIWQKARAALGPPPPKKRAPEGVLFPADAAGRRSSIGGGLSVWAAAARPLDAKLAERIAKGGATWRQKYTEHLLEMAKLSVASEPKIAVASAKAGLAALYETFDFVRDGQTTRLEQAMASPSAARAFVSGRVVGDADTPLASFQAPFDGRRLGGEALRAQLLALYEYGAMEKGAYEALCAVLSHEEWFDLRGHTFVLLGATSALGPFQTLLECGATVVAVARRKPENWLELIRFARGTAGTLVMPLAAKAPLPSSPSDAELAQAAGADLLTDTPEIAAWLQKELSDSVRPPTVGVYTYLDGELHVRVSLACDAIVTSLSATAAINLAYIQTPSIAYALPPPAHAAAAAAYASGGGLARALRWLRTPSNAMPSVPAAAAAASVTLPRRYVHDGYMPLQGPNYALAKQMQLWRALLGAHEGLRVSMNVAPAARTASMVAGANKNASRVAAGLDGMSHFPPLVVFEQEFVSAMMAALLIFDVVGGGAEAHRATASHPWALASHQAFHGGTFRCGLKPGALGIWFLLCGRLFGAAPPPKPKGD